MVTKQKLKRATWLSRKIGISFAIIWNAFNRLMTCSNKFLTLVIALVLLISAGVICNAPLLPGRAIKCRHWAAHSSKRLNSLSAIILLYLGSISKNNRFSSNFFITTYTSVCPWHKCHCWVWSNTNQELEWCLYFDQVALFSSTFFGVSINISEQSIILIKFLKCLYLFGVVAIFRYLALKKMIKNVLPYLPLAHEWNIWVQKVFDIPNDDISLPRRSNLNFIKVRKNSSFASSLVSCPNIFGVVLNRLVSWSFA